MRFKRIFCLFLVFSFVIATSCFFTFADENVSLTEYFSVVLKDTYPDYYDLIFSNVDFEQLESEGYTDFGIFSFYGGSYVSFKFSKGEDFIFKTNHFTVCDTYDFTVYKSGNNPAVIDSQSCIYVKPENFKFSFSTVPFYINDELSLSGTSYDEYMDLNHPEEVTTSATTSPTTSPSVLEDITVDDVNYSIVGIYAILKFFVLVLVCYLVYRLLNIFF